MMYQNGDTVYAVSVEIKDENDWNKFVSLEDWFEDGAPIDKIKMMVLSNPGWVHFMDVDYINMFQMSMQWAKLRDSGLAVCIKKCTVTVKGYVSPNEVCTKSVC